MIVDNRDNSSSKQPSMTNDSPPSYDDATESGSAASPSLPSRDPKPIPQYKDDPNQTLLSPRTLAPGPSGPYVVSPSYTTGHRVFTYINPITGEQVASLLPPDHPEMICLQSGQHVPHTDYGFLGILAAIFWFPVGIGLCLLDRRVRCTRCGVIIENGICA